MSTPQSVPTVPSTSGSARTRAPLGLVVVLTMTASAVIVLCSVLSFMFRPFSWVGPSARR